jgi:HAMP domain-containing protein
MTGGIENRTSRNLWLRPKSQLLLCMVLSLGFLILAGLMLFVINAFGAYLETLQGTNQIDTQTVILITSTLYPYLRIAAGIAGVFAVLGLFIGLMLSHRIYGPMIPIRNHVSKLIDGDYSSRIHLRPSDEFKELASDLNSLAERLNQKR